VFFVLPYLSIFANAKAFDVTVGRNALRFCSALDFFNLHYESGRDKERKIEEG
jgi:hypothetical protein